MIRCSIFDQQYNRALCDLGASINIMPKVIFEQQQYPTLSPTMMYVQLADSSIQYPEGKIKNMLVRLCCLWHGGRHGYIACSWTSLPMGCQGPNRRQGWRNPLLQRNGQYSLQVPIQNKAEIHHSPGPRWDHNLGGAGTPARRNTSHTYTLKKNQKGMAKGWEFVLV